MSGSGTTITLPVPISRASWTATCTAAPELPPAKMPSSRASRRAMAKACASFTWRTSSRTERSMAPHIMSSPMPSTL